MSSNAFLRTLAALVLLLFTASELACSTKNLPIGKRKRRPEVEQPTDPGTQSSESSSEQTGADADGGAPADDSGGNPASNEAGAKPEPEPELPPLQSGQQVNLLGAGSEASFAFRPQPQPAPEGGDRYATTLRGTQGHPRLYFNAEELKQLQAKAASTHKSIGRAMFGFGDRQSKRKKSLPPASMSGMGKSTGTWRRSGDRLLGVATAYAFATDPAKKKKYFDWCRESMNRLAGYPKWGPTPEFDLGLDGTHIMLGFAIALDVCYNDLSAADRKKFSERLRKQADAYYREAIKNDPIFWVSAKNVNHNYSNFNALLNAALVLENHYPEAKKWIDVVAKNAVKVMELRDIVADGSTHEGLMYASYGSSGLFMTLDLLKRHGIADHFNSTWLRQNFLYYLHGTRPGWGRVIGNADGHGFFGHGPHHLFYFMDRIFRDGRPTWTSDRIRAVTEHAIPFGKPEGCTLFFELLWRDLSVKPREVKASEITTFHHFEDWGMVTYRRDWKPTSTYFTFRAGVPPGHKIWDMILRKDPRVGEPLFSHSHPDAGSFSFYPNGKDFISGTLYQMPKRTALENTYTFTPSGKFDPPVPMSAVKKLWEPSKINQVGRLDELGQVGEWNRWYGPAKSIIKQKIQAEIVSAVNANGATYVSGEIGGFYPKQYKVGKKKQPLGVQRLYRNMLLLPEDVLVIVDRVQTSGKVESHCYFRSESTPDTPVRWNVKGNQITLSSSKANGSAIDLVHPSGLTVETGQEIFSWEDAKGDNKRGIKNWGEVAHSSVYARVTNPNQNGTQTYVYLLRPNGKAAQVSNLDLNDPNGVSFDVTVGSRVYQAKIAMELTTAKRKAFLGFDGHVKLDLLQQ